MDNNQKREILKCFPTYQVGGAKVDDIILIPHVLAKYKVGGDQAKQWLNELTLEEYLVYDDGSSGKVNGWHLTEKGYSLLYR